MYLPATRGCGERAETFVEGADLLSNGAPDTVMFPFPYLKKV
jgi:hypothetical protein